MKLKICLLLLWGICGISQGKATVFPPADSVVLEKFWEYAQVHKLSALPFDRRIPLIGEFFLNKPYKSGTLNVAVEEMPVINLRELDCVTFVENVLALTFLERYDKSATTRFVENLVKIRYRDGKIEDYTSRLHYSSDWLYEMQRRHFLKDVTREAGGVRYPLHIDFMTKNYKKYAILARDPLLLPKMRKIETAMNERAYYYIPKQNIRSVERHIEEGDILLITTNIKGLDTSHLGIAVKKRNRVYLLHASSSAGKVVVSELPLRDYMADISSQTGIMVGRAVGVPGEDWIALP